MLGIRRVVLSVYVAVVAAVVLGVIDCGVLSARFPQSFETARELLLFCGYVVSVFILFGAAAGVGQWFTGWVAEVMGRGIARITTRPSMAWPKQSASTAFALQSFPLDRILTRYLPLAYGVLSLPGIIPFSLTLFRGKGIARYHLLVAFGPWLVTVFLFFFVVAVAALILRLCRVFSSGNYSGWLVRLLILAGLCALCAGVYFADAFLYVGLYPVIHLVLTLCAFLLLELVVYLVILWRGWNAGRGRLLFTVVVTGTALAGAVALAPQWAQRGDFQLLSYERMVAGARLFKAAQFIGLSETRDAEWDALLGTDLPPPPHTPAGPWKSAQQDSAGMNVLLVTVDAFRADHCGAYGYERDNTPHITEFGQGAYLFGNAFSVGNNTHNSLLPFFEATIEPTLDKEKSAVNSPITRFHKSGYETIAVNIGDEYSAYTYLFNKYFNLVPQGNASPGKTVTDSDKTALALEVLREHKREKFVLWIDYTAPHEPYYPPAEFKRFGMSLVDLYDGELAYVDHEFARLLAGLDDLGIAGKTIVAITADHGEEFGEHGGNFHGTTLYNEQVKVPLIIRVSGRPGGIIEDEVSCIDLLPTLMHLADVMPVREMSGVTLLPLMYGKEPFSRDSVYCRGLDWRGNMVKEAVVRDGWKLIHTMAGNIHELYHLTSDPAERKNLVGREAVIYDRMKEELRRYRYAMAPAAVETAKETLDERMVKRLVSLLYGNAPVRRKKTVLRLLAGRIDRAVVEAVGQLLLVETEPFGVRNEAVEWLADVVVRDDSPGRDAAVTALRTALEGEGEDSLKAKIIRALGTIAGGVSPQELLSYLHDNAPMVREAAVKACAVVPFEDGDKILSRLMKEDESEEVRRAAIAGLGRRKSAAAVKPLLDMAGSDTDLTTRIDAIRALGAIGDDRALPVLLNSLRTSPGTNIQLNAVMALRRIGNERAMPGLMSMLPDVTNVVRNEIWNALAALCSSGDGERLVAYARYAYFPGQKIACLDAMERAGGMEVFFHLLHELAGFRVREVREKSVAALAAVARKLEWDEYLPWLSEQTVSEMAGLLELAVAQGGGVEKGLLEVRRNVNRLIRQRVPRILISGEIVEALRVEEKQWKRRELYRRFYEACWKEQNACSPFPLETIKDWFTRGNDPEFFRFVTNGLGEEEFRKVETFLREIVLDTTGTREPVLKRESLMALGAIGGEGVVRFLIEQMRDNPEAAIRYAAIDALVLSGEPSALAARHDFLRNNIDDFELRIAFCRSAATLPGPRDGELLEQCYHLEKMEEPLVLVAEGMQGVVDEEVFIFSALGPALHPNDNVRHAFITALSLAAKKLDWRELDRWLSAQTREEIEAGLKGITSMEKGMWLKKVEAIIDAFHEGVKVDRPPVDVTVMLDHFTEEEPAWRRREIARRFGEGEMDGDATARDKVALEVMERYTVSDEGRYKLDCVRALGNLRESSTVELLRHLIVDGRDIPLVAEAVMALGKAGGEESVDELIALHTESNYERIRCVAIVALGHTGSNAAREFLAGLLRKKTTWDIHVRACRALGMLLRDGDRELLEECGDLCPFDESIAALIEGVPEYGGYHILTLLVEDGLTHGGHHVRDASLRAVRKLMKKENVRRVIDELPPAEREKLFRKMTVAEVSGEEQ